MAYTHLITATQLQDLLNSNSKVVIFDCSHDATTYWQSFEQQRIKGAVASFLERDLSTFAAEKAVNAGRHPLPKPEIFAAYLTQSGLTHDAQAVVYDRNNNSHSGRLWWMLKWLGHNHVAILDGGLAAWLANNGATESGEIMTPTPAATPYQPRLPLRKLVFMDEVLAKLDDEQTTIIDARSHERYLGKVEPLDKVAGHIPNALNRPFADNFQADGHFKSPEVLRQEWCALLQGRENHRIIHYCGSGVTAIPNLFAMELAGFAPTALYAGSWSEWSNREDTPKIGADNH